MSAVGLEPLRIGLLGASRIAELAVTHASRETGDVRAAVAARDPERARAYAAEHGYEGIRDSYEALIGDDSLDLVYIGLPNGLHGVWAAAALEAGRNVLVEKPFAANLAEFDRVVSRLDEPGAGFVWEAFHHADHPLVQRILEIVASGRIGEITAIDVRMDMVDPGAGDPRWSFELAGGALMDVGCYAVNMTQLIAEALHLPLSLRSARATPATADARVDAEIAASLTLGDIPVALHASMVSDGWDFSLRVTGTGGELFAPSFPRPFIDDRILVTSDGETREEHLGALTSYVYQLRRLREAVRLGSRSRVELDRSRRTMALIDEIYAESGMPARPAGLLR